MPTERHVFPSLPALQTFARGTGCRRGEAFCTHHSDRTLALSLSLGLPLCLSLFLCECAANTRILVSKAFWASTAGALTSPQTPALPSLCVSVFLSVSLSPTLSVSLSPYALLTLVREVVYCKRTWTPHFSTSAPTSSTSAALTSSGSRSLPNCSQSLREPTPPFSSLP